MFNVDWNKYRLVDISRTIVPTNGKETDRPFEVELFTLADGAYGYNVKLHTHVGTHVEAPMHFYGEGKGKLASDYAPDYFMGRGILLEANAQMIDANVLERNIGDIIRDGDIVIARKANSSVQHKPYLTIDGAQWLADKGMKILGFDTNFALGTNVEQGRKIHDMFLSKDILFIEFLDNLDAISKREFYFMGLPYKASIDSSWIRAVVIEEI